MNRITRLRAERGSVLVAGILVLAIISMLGMVALRTVSVQTHQTGVESAGERAFNLAESALNSESSLLESRWPATQVAAYPVCNQNSVPTSTCPAGSVTAGYNPSYVGAGFASPAAAWSVEVVDDNAGNANYYADSILTSGQLQHWDSNGDNKLWIRADATVRGQHRIAVAQIGRQVNVVKLPQSVITAGGVGTTNNGNKIIIQANDPNSGLAGPVDLRCGNSNTQPSYGSSCAGWDPKKGQLSPAGDYQTGYVDPNGNYQTLSEGTLEALRETAEANGTYYPPGQCPPLGQPGLLFIENANCTYSSIGQYQWNSDASPGAVIAAAGTLEFGANVNYYGVIYMANGQGTVPASGPCTPAQQNPVYTVQGGSSLHGGLFVGNCGTVEIGEAAYDFIYDVKAFSGVQTYATPSLALNTFRIVPNG
jgi:hypothetical protein